MAGSESSQTAVSSQTCSISTSSSLYLSSIVYGRAGWLHTASSCTYSHQHQQTHTQLLEREPGRQAGRQAVVIANSH